MVSSPASTTESVTMQKQESYDLNEYKGSLSYIGEVLDRDMEQPESRQDHEMEFRQLRQQTSRTSNSSVPWDADNSPFIDDGWWLPKLSLLCTVTIQSLYYSATVYLLQPNTSALHAAACLCSR